MKLQGDELIPATTASLHFQKLPQSNGRSQPYSVEKLDVAVAFSFHQG
jgi:hypothetical protein